MTSPVSVMTSQDVAFDVRKFKEYIDVKMEEKDSGFSVEGFLKIFEVN